MTRIGVPQHAWSAEWERSGIDSTADTTQQQKRTTKQSYSAARICKWNTNKNNIIIIKTLSRVLAAARVVYAIVHSYSWIYFYSLFCLKFIPNYFLSRFVVNRVTTHYSHLYALVERRWYWPPGVCTRGRRSTRIIADFLFLSCIHTVTETLQHLHLARSGTFRRMARVL